MGSLFELSDCKTGQTKLYFIVLKGGGETVVVEEKEIIMITAVSPLGRASVSSKKGDRIFCNGRVYLVNDIE